MSKKISIPQDNLEELYQNRRLSTHQIAKEFSCDPSVIQRRLKEYRIKIRYSKKKIEISKEKLYEFYVGRGMSTYKIARRLGISSCCVYYKLKENGISTRSKKIVRISKEKLNDLYNDKQMSLSKMAKLYDCSTPVILDKMRNYNLKRRDLSNSNIIYPKKKFLGNNELKSYMIGFRLGDLNVTKNSKNSSIIKVKSSTTKLDQFNLIKDIYGSYGHFWYKKYGEVFNMCIQLDKSFSFLLVKEDNVPTWILKNKKYFFAFLGGYTDAEGNIQVSKKIARFRIRSYDKQLLNLIYQKLNSLGIKSNFGIASKKGFISGVKHNKDSYGVSIGSKENLLVLFKFLKPHIKHKKRFNDLEKAEINIIERNKKRKTGVKL